MMAEWSKALDSESKVLSACVRIRCGSIFALFNFCLNTAFFTTFRIPTSYLLDAVTSFSIVSTYNDRYIEIDNKI